MEKLKLKLQCADVVVSEPKINNNKPILYFVPIKQYGIKNIKLLAIIYSRGCACNAHGDTVIINS